MSEQDERDPVTRTDEDRARDHSTIDRLADELLPALVAKLGASGLGEIEVREGDWRIRLRMPATADERPRARRAGAGARGAPGSAAPLAGTAGSGRGEDDSPWPVASGPRGSGGEGSRAVAHEPRPRAVATSPGVGVYSPRPGLSVGSRVRAGDRLGSVDVLGVRHDVVAPTDGVIGGSYADPGEAVEYGQELIRIELPGAPAGGSGMLDPRGQEPLEAGDDGAAPVAPAGGATA
jgi:biotin carboxyl carrier protein